MVTIVLIVFLGGLNFVFFPHQHSNPVDSNELLGRRVQYGMLHIFSGDNPAEELFDYLKTAMGFEENKTEVFIVFENSRDPAPLINELIYNQLIKRNGFRADINIYNAVILSIISWQQGMKEHEKIRLMEQKFNQSEYILYITNTKEAYTSGRGEYREFYNERIKKLFYLIKDDLGLVWSYKDDEDFFTEEMFLFRRKES